MGCKGVSKIAVRFGRSGEVRELNLVQIVEEVSAIRVGFQSEPVFGWRGCSVLRDYRHRLPFGTACYKLRIVEIMMCS